MQTDLFDHMKQTLESEREMLRAGDFDGVSKLIPMKLEIEKNLSIDPPTSRQLQAIQRLSMGNQKLLEASIRGLKSARSRLDQLDDVRSGLSLYNQTGSKERVSMPSSKLKKKA